MIERKLRKKKLKTKIKHWLKECVKFNVILNFENLKKKIQMTDSYKILVFDSKHHARSYDTV